MPSAMLGRIRFTAAGLAIGEYLHREETLFAEPEWSWVADQKRAMIFPSLELASDEGMRQKRLNPNSEWFVFPLVCGPSPESSAARERREQDRIASALASTTPPAAEDTHLRRAAEALEKERRAPRQKPAPKPSPKGPEAWKEVFHTRIEPHHVPPQESFEQLERRHLA